MYTRTNCLIVFPQQLVTDSQSTSMYMMGHKKDGKSKRWSHLRIVRVVVPSGKSARGGGGKKKSRERRDVRWKQCQLRAECIDYSENESRSSHELGSAGGHMTHAKCTAQVLTDLTKGRQKKPHVSPYWICLSVTLQGPDHKVSCHSKFGDQFSKSETSWWLSRGTRH